MLLALVVLLGLWGGLEGCSRAEPGDHVIVVLLDAARSDRFSSYGYERVTTPRMDALAADGALFPVHYTQGTHTRRSLPSLLFSRYFARPVFPNSDRVPFAAPEDLFRGDDPSMISLPGVFQKAGYRTALISAHAWIKPNTSIAAEYQELRDLTVREDIDKHLRYPRAEVVIDEALEWIDAHWEEDFFLFVHLMDTHFPHAPGPEALAYLEPSLRQRVAEGWRPPELLATGRPADIEAPLSPEARNVLDALYDGSLRYADHHVGRLLDHLGDNLPRTLIAITSDHGESLVEVPGRFAHGGPWYETVARIPLILYGPEDAVGRGVQSLSYSESVDLLPTLAAAAGLEIPAERRVDGVDLLPTLKPRSQANEGLSRDLPSTGVATRGAGISNAASSLWPLEPVGDARVAFQHGAVRYGDLKVIFNADDEVLLGPTVPDLATLNGEVYNLLLDPLEVENLWQREPAVAEALVTKYRERMLRPWARFTGATSSARPTSPFALSIHHWDGFRTLRRDNFNLTPDGPPWAGLEHGSQHVLFGRPGAPPVEVGYPLPNGRYAVSATVQGKGQVVWGEEQGVDIDGGPWVGRTSGLRVEIGEVSITDEQFKMTLRPADDTPLLIRFFGFRPLQDQGPVNDDSEARRALEEQLESLGYIQ